MQILVFIAIFMASLGTWANDDWVEITPMPHCPEFKIEYKFMDRYYLRYRSAPGADYTVFEKSLEDINNLSQLTDELHLVLENWCPNNFVVSLGEEQIMCVGEQVQDPFGQTYADLLKAIILSSNQGKTGCEDVIPLIELQKEISHLRSEDLIDFDRSGNILRLFVDKDSDQLIDHFRSCGGKKGSKQFIKNLVIIESKKACLFPSPPGLLSFEKTLKVAEEIAEEYPDMTLLKLNSNQDHIVKNALLKFVNVIFTDQIKSLLGEDYDAQKIIDNLDSVKKLKAEKPKYVQDHIQYILPLNATLEIVDVGLPLIIKENFKDILPETMSQADKDSFLQDTLMPEVLADYNKCIERIKDRIDYPTNMSSKELITKRKRLERQFCEDNIEECRDPNCGSIKNLLTSRKDITDMQMVQACVFKSFSKALKPTLKLIVKGQEKTIGQYLDFNEKVVNEVTDSAYKTLHTCADQKLKKKTGHKYKEKFDENIEVLYHISSNDFIEVITECSAVTEESQVNDFIAIIIDSIDLVRKEFGNGKTKTILGVNIDEGSFQFSQNIIEKTIPKCQEIQKFRAIKYKELSPSSLNCTPLIEMEAARAILNKSVEETLLKYKIKAKDNTITPTFNACVDKAELAFQDGLFNPKHPHAILNSNDADNYLKNNHEFYSCVSSAVLALTDIAGNVVLKEATKDIANQIEDPAYFQKLIPNIKKKLTSCFKQKLDEIGSWPNFLIFNEQDGLEKLEAECSEVAIEYALPEVIANEISLQVKDLVEVQLINQNESKKIYEKLKLSMIQKYDIENKNPKTTQEVLKEAYISYREAHKESKDLLSDFVTSFTNTVEPIIISSISDFILDDVVSKAKPKYDLTELPKYLTSQCIADHFIQNKNEIYKLIDDIGKLESDLNTDTTSLRETFVDIIMQGAIRSQEQNRYNDFLKQVKLACESPKKFKDLNKLIALGVGDDVIMSQLQPVILEEFLDIVKTQCFEGISEQKLDKILTSKEKELICTGTETSSGQMEAIKKTLYSRISDPKTRSMIDLILYRRAHSQQLVMEKFNDKDFLDKTFLRPENRDFINFIYNNLGKIILEDKQTENKLILMATAAIFKDTSNGSFAERFVEGQLIYEIGSSQYDEINQDVIKTTSEINWKNSDLKEYVLKDRIKKKAEISFGNVWRYENIKEYLAFDYVESYKKQALVKKVVELGVLTKVDKNMTPTLQEKKSKELKNHVTNYMNHLDRVPNPEYDPTKPEYNKKTIWTNYGPIVPTIPIPQRIKVKDNPQYLTLEQRVKYDITEEISRQVKDDIGNDLESLKEGFKVYLKMPKSFTPIIPFR